MTFAEQLLKNTNAFISRLIRPIFAALLSTSRPRPSQSNAGGRELSKPSGQRQPNAAGRYVLHEPVGSVWIGVQRSWEANPREPNGEAVCDSAGEQKHDERLTTCGLSEARVHLVERPSVPGAKVKRIGR